MIVTILGEGEKNPVFWNDKFMVAKLENRASLFRKNIMSEQIDQVYQSFLVRCWLIPAATADEPPAWRFELRDVSAEPEKHGFSDLEQLKDFIAIKLETLTLRNKR